MSIARAACHSFAVASLLSFAVPAAVHAREDGIAVQDCGGCHAGGGDTDVSVSASANDVALGQTVRLTVSIAAASANAGGFYLVPLPQLGRLVALSGQGTKLNGAGITHSAPKPNSGQSVTFAVDWVAPLSAGDVEFFVYGVAADGNGRSSGDSTGTAKLSLTFGCTGSEFYSDYDLDGVGNGNDAKRACSQPASYSATPGDCDDYDQAVHPGADERCNGRDDDCDGAIDEDLTIASYCQDKDGDGHGVPGQATKMGCGPSSGFGLCDDDCDDGDDAVFPGADEQCNYRDDNCNGRTDEDARTYCGTGWCRRSAEGCGNTLCVPGAPRAEECNYLDDDCDGEIDNAAKLCPSGQACVEGACVAGAGSSDAGGSGPDARVGSLDGGSLGPASTGDGGGGCALAGGRGGASALAGLMLLLLLRRRAHRHA